MIRTTSMALAIAAVTATSAFAGGKLGEVSDAVIEPPVQQTGSVAPYVAVGLLAVILAVGLADDKSGGSSSSTGSPSS